MIKKIIIISGIILAFAGGSLLAQGFSAAGTRLLGTNSIVAIVEDKIITRDEIMKELAPMIPQIQARARNQMEFNNEVNRLFVEVVQNLVDRELIIKDFKDKNFQIPQSTLDSYFEDYLQREFGGDRAEFLKYVQSQNKTVKQVREEFEESLIVSSMQQQKRMTVSEVSPTKIKDYYEQNKNKWYSPASARVSQIMINLSRSPNPENTKKLAADIVKKARAGEDFAELAKRYSQDAGASKGGDLGIIKKGDFTPVIDEAVFKLKEGEVSDPIETGGIIFIFKVFETKKEGIQPIDEVRDQIEWILVEQNQKITYQKWLESLRKKAYVKYYD